MKIDKKYSIRKAEELLDKKGALKACQALIEKCDGQLKDDPELLEELGIEAEWTIPTGSVPFRAKTACRRL